MSNNKTGTNMFLWNRIKHSIMGEEVLNVLLPTGDGTIEERTQVTVFPSRISTH